MPNHLYKTCRRNGALDFAVSYSYKVQISSLMRKARFLDHNPEGDSKVYFSVLTKAILKNLSVCKDLVNPACRFLSYYNLQSN
jgi:hypothetical protein